MSGIWFCSLFTDKFYYLFYVTSDLIVNFCWLCEDFWHVPGRCSAEVRYQQRIQNRNQRNNLAK